MPKRIPIAAARRFARDQQCRQVIIFAWDGERSHVVTYGKSVEDCARAAELGNQMKRGLGWPESLQAQPSRVRAAIHEAVLGFRCHAENVLRAWGVQDIDKIVGEIFGADNAEKGSIRG